MTQDEIIAMAHEAEIYVVRPDEFQNLCIKDLERFAKLVAAHEREACAKIFDRPEWNEDVAAIIRARNNNE